jgi:hypothetical protein
VHAARESVGGAFIAAQRVADAGLGTIATQLRHAASSAFFDGFAIGCIVAAGIALLGAIVAAVLLPAHPHTDDDITEWETENDRVHMSDTDTFYQATRVTDDSAQRFPEIHPSPQSSPVAGGPAMP